MHRPVVSEAIVRALFVVFLILRCTEDREAYKAFQPFACYKVIAHCPLKIVKNHQASIIQAIQVLPVHNPIRDRRKRTIFLQIGNHS